MYSNLLLSTIKKELIKKTNNWLKLVTNPHKTSQIIDKFTNAISGH